jgi:hypothetical protein
MRPSASSCNPEGTYPRGVETLAPAPRAVPASFVLAEVLPLRWWYVVTLSIVAVAPISKWMSVPSVVAPVAVGTLVVIYAFQIRGAAKRLALLKWDRWPP